MAVWDWLELLPTHERGQGRRRRRILRLRSQLLRPRIAIILLIFTYLLVVLALALQIGSILALLAAMPLLLAPLLSGLTFWLLWSEFHR